ncbi:MAG: gephyrin-like molybdotransferase Glp [Solirubrobacteraceae bacterium]
MAAPLTEIGTARRIVLERSVRLGSEPVPLAEALDRVLAAAVNSVDPVPAFDNSAMDGFAVRADSVRGAGPLTPVTLQTVGESRAGHAPRSPLSVGEAAPISTGAEIPAGADAVVPVEQTRLRDGLVEVLEEVPAGRHVRRAGADIRAGQRVLAAGTRLGAAELGVLASLGRREADCSKRPRVAVITTGDELLRPGEPPMTNSIYDSNAYSIPALARQFGGELLPVVTVRDDARETERAIADAIAAADVAVLCGGVSVGVHDHVREGLAALGVNEHFWGLALRPGKPTWFGTSGETLVFALPGNPVSAIVTFILFAAPALAAMSGASDRLHLSTATISSDYAKVPGRAHAVRCRLRLTEHGWLAEPTGAQGSHVLTSMLGADALAIIPTGKGDVQAGERVEIVLLPNAALPLG